MSAQQARERKKNYVQTLEERNQLQVRNNHPCSCLCQASAVRLLAEQSTSKDAACVVVLLAHAEHVGSCWDTCRWGSPYQAGTRVWQLQMLSVSLIPFWGPDAVSVCGAGLLDPAACLQPATLLPSRLLLVRSAVAGQARHC